MVDEVVELEFAVGARPELSINTISGQVDVRAGEGSTIRLHATKHGSRQTVENTRIEASQDGNRVRIQTKADKSGLLNLSRNVSSVDYDVVVPRDCEVHIESVSADVRVEGVYNAVHTRSVSGDVVLVGISGDCQVTTVSGDVSGNGVVGALSLRTTSGDTTIGDSQLRHFNLNSVSGDFSIDTPLTPGQHYLAKTVSGDLQLSIPPGTGATVQMKSVSGDVRSDLPAEIIKQGRRHWQGRINGGGANVGVSSVSGDLRIAQSGATALASAPAPRSPEPAPVPDAPSFSELPAGLDLPPTSPFQAEEPSSAGVEESETNAVLKQLERGEISVEEAIARLDRLQ
jgi:hypothetical protein